MSENPTAEFRFDGERFVLDGELWAELDERWPDGVERPNPEVAERIVREIAEPAGGESA